ncbi:MAG: DUF2505 domain-containing protein [Sciscionella sp.]
MPRRIEHRARHTEPAAVVYSALVDADYLRERLRSLGGKGAALESHEVSEQGARYRVRHGLDAGALPSVVRTVISGDLVIERTEAWQPRDGGYTGRSTVTIPKTPAEITATLRLADTGSGSTLDTECQVEVAIPLFGGSVEETIAQHVRKLLDSEYEFTKRWLAEHAAG